jgi:predicted lipid-binding transport protein (Tim44 family)
MEPISDPLPAATHWLDHPRNVKRLWRGFLGVLALTVLAGLVIPLHPQFAIEALFGFSAWFGFGACAAMIVVARGLALLLKRPDSYYEHAERRDV